MSEEAKDKTESKEENQSEKVDNRLPYSPPTLRKHGKINHATNNIAAPGFNDFLLDPFFFEDFS